MKQYSRKEFIRLSTATGAALWLSACGLNDGNSKQKEAQRKSDPATKGKTTGKRGKLDLVDKNDTRYDELRRGFNKRIDKHPAVIAVCRSTEDVVAAVQYAKENKLPVAVKSGGHCMEGYSCSDGGMVINLARMDHVELLSNNQVKAGPGCLLYQLNDTVLPRGRILPAGSCATVGLGGLTLGGGYGLLSKKFGLTCDHLVEATMVDGNGNVHSTKDNPELLWALRGGGTGNFGIATELIYYTHEAPETLQAHYFKSKGLTPDKAAGILKAWMEISAQFPETCFSGFVLNGRTLNILVTNYGDNTDKRFQSQLQQLANSVDTFKSSRVGKLQTMLRNYYGRPHPLNFRNSSAGYFKGYADVDKFITGIFEKIMATPGMIYQVNTMGGKIKDATFEKGSSYPHRAFDFVSEVQGYWEASAQGAAIATSTTAILKMTAEYGILRQYVNYCSSEFANWESAYYDSNYPRLQAIKKKYDPDDIIRHPQSIKLPK